LLIKNNIFLLRLDVLFYMKKNKNCRAKETSSKIWLSKHGLVAKKLTILDALAPTFIPRKAKYVPILDRHVLSKE
jgi:hypothetical protein